MAGEEQAETKWFKRFLTLFFAGFLMILLGIAFLIAVALLSGTGTANTGWGIIIWLWFFPIVIGAGPEAHWLILIAAILAALGIIVLFMTRKTVGKDVQR